MNTSGKQWSSLFEKGAINYPLKPGTETYSGTIVVIRHAEPLSDSNHNVIGWTDPSLQSEAYHGLLVQKMKLRGLRAGKVFTSDLKRAIETASLIAPVLSANVEISSLIKEANFGILEGISKSSQKYRKASQDRNLDKYLYRPENGESYSDVTKRVVKFFQKNFTFQPNVEPLILISHLGVMRAIACLFADISNDTVWNLNSEYLGVAIADFDQQQFIWSHEGLS